jgi:hypothetical protein
MLAKLASRLTYSNVVSTVCLFVVLGGGAYAATSLPKNSIGAKQVKANAIGSSEIKSGAVGGSEVRNDSLSGADIKEGSLGRVASAARAANADSATTAGQLGGSPASAYQKYGATLPSGKSMSGDYGIREAGTPPAGGWIDTSASFPIPLAARIPAANVVYTTSYPATHCAGPGQAERGYLCVYQINSASVTNPPEILAFEAGAIQSGSGLYGFNMEWDVTGMANPFSIGTWTVTAP